MIDIDSIFLLITSLFYQYKIIAIICLFCLIIFVWKKPAKSFKFGVFIVIMVAVLYLINLMGGAMFEGAGNKNNAALKTEKELS